MNQTQTDLLANNSTLNFEGWNHGGIDTTDRFTFDVPINHGVFVEMECYDCDGYMVLDFYDSTGAYVGYGGATFAGYLSYNTSSYVTSLPSTLGVGVRNWFGYDDDGDDYYLNITFYSLDADGDGWLDQDEWDCGTDPNDPTSFPTDTDGDGICDANDEDIDGDGIGNDLDEMPFDENQSSDMDGDGIADADDLDRDGDDWDNIAELICLGATSNADYDANITPSDYDGDGLCDTVADSDVDHVLADTYLDPDGDDDGTNDEDDAFAFDECADTDTDRDGMPDDIFGGLDGDGNHDWANAVPGVDHDGDGEYDNLVDADGDGAYGSSNDDADGDGLTNFQEAAAYGGYTWSVSDYCHPGTPSGLTEDTDDDNDGHLDEYEIDCGSSPTEAADMPQDSTIHADLGGWSNGLCDALDPDDDNDGYNDTEDVWPFDHTEWADADGDLQGDNRDMDDDNDGWWDSCDLQDWLDAQDAAVVEGVNYFTGEANGVSSTCPAMADAFPMDGTEWIDTDGDTIGDNADADDDGDTWTDAEEDACGTDSLDASSIPLDSDDDGYCDIEDLDDDGDGINDAFDAFPLDTSETADLDGNGIGDNLDPDDDGDGWFDDVETSCFTDPLDSFSVPTDFDGDGMCDEQDNDDDGDGVDDDLDAFPYDTMETNDHDGDGIGDLADSDDDNDGWYDYAELACLSAGGAGDKNNANEYPNDFDVDGVCDAVDPDDDNDGFPDPACVGSASTTEYVDCAVGDEDRFPRDSAEWYDANEDGLGDNGAPVTLIDNIKYDPVPYVGIVGVIGAMGYGLLQMSQRAGLGGDEDDAEDYTEEFEDFDFEDDDQEED